MGAERYEVVIVNARTGRQTNREWQEYELLKGVAWLKRMNAQGSDIYLRPLVGPELILADSLSAETLSDMHRHGFEPTLAIATSPGRFQAWMKLSDQQLPKEVRKQVISGLGRVFPSVVEYGRLAGFTNHLVASDCEGRQPYLLAYPAAGKVAPACQPFLAAIERNLRELAFTKQRSVDSEKVRHAFERYRSR
jgi:hypothetical protein